MPETSDHPPAAMPNGTKKRSSKKWLITAFKIVIAVLGIWFVCKTLTWNDSATLPAGTDIGTLKFVEDTDVTVAGPGNLPGKDTVRIDFPTRPIKVEVETLDAAGHPTQSTVDLVIDDDPVIPGTQQHLQGIKHEIIIDTAHLKEEKGSRIRTGLHTLIIEASGKWYLLLMAWALLGVPFFVTAIRWRNLMIPQGIDMPLAKCIQLTFVGQFYSIMLPGVTGGDLVKIVYAARLTGSKTKSFITIILDRVIGLVALMVIAGTSAGIQVVMNARAGTTDNTLLNVFVMILILLAVLATGATVYFSHRLRKLVGIEWFVEHFGADDSAEVRHEKLEHLFRVINILVLIAGLVAAGALAALRFAGLAWAVHNSILVFIAIALFAGTALAAAIGLLLHEKLVTRASPLMGKGVEALVRVDETLHVYRGHFGLLLWAFVISLFSQLTLPLSAWLSGTAFGMTSPVTHYLAYVPVAVLAASLPVSPPQGVGVMDWLLKHFFADQGSAKASQAFALAQCVRFLPMIWNLFGAYWVITGSYSRHHAQEEAQALPAEPAPPNHEPAV